jgi:hypothetical protein
MKLNLLFILMDPLTVLAYPVMFMHGKLHNLSKLENDISLVIFCCIFQPRQADDPMGDPKHPEGR